MNEIAMQSIDLCISEDLSSQWQWRIQDGAFGANVPPPPPPPLQEIAYKIEIL